MTAVIAPSVVYETFGLNLIEAMSQGVPVIAARLGALEELVKKSGAGILFNWANSEELAKALHNISDMKYRRRAVDYMRQNHLPEEYFGNLLKIYTELKHGKKS